MRRGLGRDQFRLRLCLCVCLSVCGSVRARGKRLELSTPKVAIEAMQSSWPVVVCILLQHQNWGQKVKDQRSRSLQGYRVPCRRVSAGRYDCLGFLFAVFCIQSDSDLELESLVEGGELQAAAV